MSDFGKYLEAVRYIENLPSIHNGCFIPMKNTNPQHYLKRTRWFLEHLGNPDKEMKFIHITGTSGKGSVSKMLSEILSASGRKTGLFTSPFPTTSLEKIWIDGLYVSPGEFADLVERIKPVLERAEKECPWGVPTYFEIFMSIALLYFKENGCEWIILEVGCGGRYDSTNVIEKKEVAIITNINFDHTHIIGDTLEKIAYEKAGIIKKGCSFFTAEERSEFRKMFFDICKEEGAEYIPAKENVKGISYSAKGMIVRAEGFGRPFSINLWGEYQVKNVALALAVAKYLGINEEAIFKGVQRAKLSCRFELMQEKPSVILDAAHNPAKMKSTVSNLEKLEYNKLILVFGMADKNETDETLSLIVPKADHIICTTFGFGKPLSGKEFEFRCGTHIREGAFSESEEDMGKALDKAIKIASEKDLILVTGSFYLSGELRKKWISEEYILKNRKSFK